MNTKIKIAPSILNADLANLQSEIARLENAGVELLHIDVMDGVFVPPMTMGDVVVKSLRSKSNLLFDAHLMVSNPSERLIKNFADSGSDIITIHVEQNEQVAEKLAYIRELGCKAGLALNPPTPVSEVLPYIGLVDMFVVMSVNPGYGGQAFIPESADKIAQIREKTDVAIQVDGGINDKTAPIAVSAGASVLVAGSYLMNAADINAAVASLRGRTLSECE